MAFIFHMCFLCSKTFNAVPWFWPSDLTDLDLVGWPTLKKIVLGFWIRGVTYCCYLHLVAASELCCLLWQLWYLVILTLNIYLLLKNFNLGCYLVTVAARRAPLSSDNSYFKSKINGFEFCQIPLQLRIFHSEIIGRCAFLTTQLSPWN